MNLPNQQSQVHAERQGQQNGGRAWPGDLAEQCCRFLDSAVQTDEVQYVEPLQSGLEADQQRRAAFNTGKLNLAGNGELLNSLSARPMVETLANQKTEHQIPLPEPTDA